MREYSIREQFARDIEALLSYCHKMGYGVTFGEGYRTADQQRIYNEGWRYISHVGYWVKDATMVRSQVTRSKHQDRLAMDFNIWDATFGSKEISEDEWRKVGAYWESLGENNRWGGRFGIKPEQYDKLLGWDRWHFERSQHKQR